MSNEFAGIAGAALEMLHDDMVVGLGTGRAATAFVRALGKRVRAGLRVRGVPTSQATADLAEKLGIPLAGLGEVDEIDIAVDGADEVAPNLDLIKGLGGALVREKIVASAASRLVILVGSEKLVPALGSRGLLPVEVVPFGLDFCRRRIEALGYGSEPRESRGKAFVTDNGNYVLDVHVPLLGDPQCLELALRDIPGLVATGLFLGMTDTVLVQDKGGVRKLE